MEIIFKRVKVLQYIDGKRCIFDLMRMHDFNYTGGYKAIMQLEEAGLIETVKNGKERIPTLTQKGEKVRDCVCELIRLGL